MLPSGEGLVMGQEPHTHQMAQLSLSTQNYSLGVVVAILSIYIKLLALRKDKKKKKKKGKNFREILRGLDMGAGIGWGRTGSQLSGTTFPSLRACRAILASHPPTSLGQGCPVLKCPLILGSPIPEAQDKEERPSHSHPFHEAAGYCHRVTIAAVQVSEKLAVGGKETIRPPPL